MDESLLVVPGTDLRGPDRWEEVFGRPGLLTVEIGFGKDEFLLDLAERDPEGLYLGVDFSRPRTRSFLRKIRRRGLTNVRVLREHAATVLGYLLGDGTVKAYYALFPDPWPKKRHATHRLVSPWFAREAARTLVPGGRITLATDDAPYRDQMISVLEGHGAFTNLRGPGGFGPRPPGIDATLFEQRWTRHGRGIFYLEFERRRR